MRRAAAGRAWQAVGHAASGRQARSRSWSVSSLCCGQGRVGAVGVAVFWGRGVRVGSGPGVSGGGFLALGAIRCSQVSARGFVGFVVGRFVVAVKSVVSLVPE